MQYSGINHRAIPQQHSTTMSSPEHCQTTSEHFKYLVTALEALYPAREANTIATYVFEDLFEPLNANTAERSWSTAEREQFKRVLRDLQQQRPWQYVVGLADFYGLKFRVDERVLIPRPETEELVHYIIQQHKGQPLQVLDVGTGSGCIAVTLKKNWPKASVMAVDVSADALLVAQSNALDQETAVSFKALDVLDPLEVERLPLYDVIVSNPPYILHEERPLMTDNVRYYEPELALYVTDNDPLQFYKMLARLGRQKLQPNGWLYLEINEHFGPEVVALLQSYDYQQVALHQDMAGRDRMVMAQQPNV